MKTIKKAASIGMIVAMLFLTIGCTTHIHNVGNGPQTHASSEARQWYILWGLVPLNEIDTRDMAGDSDDYEIVTESSPIDIIIGIFTGIITVHSRTVTVTK